MKMVSNVIQDKISLSLVQKEPRQIALGNALIANLDFSAHGGL